MFSSFNVRGFAAVSALFLFAASAAAQVITVNPSTSLTAGSTATISYANASLANQEVTIEISGGFPVPQFQTITIQLDETGKGSGTWTVARWRNAFFDAPGALPVTLPIL